MTPSVRAAYPLSDARPAPAEVETGILEHWKANDTFARTVESRRSGKPFVFFEGPPTANGRPGVHHVLARTVKDLVCRYQSMCGRHVSRRGGWDTHGLPVELEVEKALGISDKREIERMGIGEFNRRCRESVFTYLDQWRDITERIGYWVDMDEEYVTLENDYIESVWALLRKIADKGLIYQGYKVVPYSTRSGTTLSDHEVALGYREVEDPSITVRFRLAEEPGVSFLVWTTTPWTLPGNSGLAVHPEVDYVRARHDGEVVILAKDLVESVLGPDAEVLSTVPGRDLVGLRYEPLFDFFADRAAQHKNAFRVVPGDFVTTTDGTGIVHQAPAFGAEDLESAGRHDLPVIHSVDGEGKLTAEAGDFAGLWFKDADRPVLRDLRGRGLLFHETTCRHTYPFNWRGDDPLMYVAKRAWYIRTTDIAGRMVDLNREIRWVPSHIRDGRFGNWLENNVDWALSRERFWGTPLPIWVSDKTGRMEVVGSVAELSEKSGRDLSELDLHRPHVDEITWPDGEGGTMHRVPEVLDVWFDSGAMPFAQWHYPFENEEVAKEQFPADFICEGVDQTRGWFYSLHAIAALVEDRPAYRACLVTGLLMGEDGTKMSKSRGNTVDPWEAVDIGGADALRWFLVVTNTPWQSLRFSKGGVAEVSRKILDTVRNLYAFFARYANLDGFVPDAESAPPVSSRPVLDRWVLSRLNAVTGTVRTELDRYEVSRAGRAMESFVMEDLSNWFVRRSRARFWAPGFDEDKRAAYETLHECLSTVARLMAPFAPFLAERLHLDLREGSGVGPESVHLADYPHADDALVDAELERVMEDVRCVVRLGRAGRNRAAVKTRQPLSRVRIVPPEGGAVFGEHTSVVLEELNVREAEFGTPGEAVPGLSAKARFDVLGPRFGKSMKAVATAVAALSGEEVSRIERRGSISVRVADETHVISREEVIISHEDPDGWVLEREGGWSVALDLNIDDDLRNEGFAREIVNKIQFMRKSAGFSITDRIEVGFEGTDALRDAVKHHDDMIRRETQADRIVVPAGDGETREEWTINGEPAVLALRRV